MLTVTSAMPRAVIVISSHVVRGTVGNRAAVFALETLGFPVWAVPTVTLAWHPGFTGHPSELAERLPKALIHRNVPGEPIHELLRLADRCWDRTAGFAPYGGRARWRAAAALLAERTDGAARAPRRPVRDNILTVDWSAVAPTW